MTRCFVLLTAIALVLAAGPASAAGISGQYVEARTCDVWTGPCFANAEMNLGGKHAVMAWKVDKGQFDRVALDGLSVVAVVSASDTLGLQQTGPAKAVLIVDQKASASQREALLRLAQKQGGELLQNVVAVQSAPIDLTLCECDNGACAKVDAGQVARIETRCVKADHDKVCGNESAFYPPLAQGVKAQAAVAVRHSFSGKDFNETWSDSGRRGAYVGTFSVK
jgi:hypothetical protein